MNVLIVERDELLAEVMATTLTDRGIGAKIIQDDAKAMEACEPDSPDLVITSINRGREDMRGLALVRAMRSRCPLISAIYMAAVWPARLHSGALGLRERFLQKPVPPEKLVQTVRELLPV
jgi:DNA-binding NtrC family response regulator